MEDIWYVMACAIPGGTQMVAVQAPTRREAIIHAELEVKKAHKLPASYQILGRVIHECALEAEAQKFMDRLHEVLEKEKEADVE